jgi:hypothetical protein
MLELLPPQIAGILHGADGSDEPVTREQVVKLLLQASLDAPQPMAAASAED